MPKFAINEDTPLSPATGDFNSSIPVRFLTSPANFSFPAFAELEVDTGSNFIPLKFTHLNALVYDLQTSVKVGNGSIFGITVPAKKFTKLQMPVNFSYVADNSSDLTCKLLLFSLPPFCTAGLTRLISQGRAGITPAETGDSTRMVRGRVRSFVISLGGIVSNTNLLTPARWIGLRFRIVLEMWIAGLIGSRFTSTQVTDASCPVELAMNAS